MANDVVITLAGREADLIKAFQRTEREMDKILKRLGDVEGQSKKTGEQGIRVLGTEAEKTFGTMVAKLATIDQAVAFTRTAYQEWQQDMQRLAQEAITFSDTLTKTIVQAGDAANAAKIEQRIKTFQAGEKVGERAFAGVREGAPGVGVDRALDLAEAASRGALAGEDPFGLAKLAGSLEKLVPDAAAGDVVDLALATRMSAGRDIERVATPRGLRGINALVATGAATPEEALGFAISGLRADQSPMFAGQVARLIDRDITDPRTEAETRFATAGPRERLGLLQTDEDVRREIAGGQVGLGLQTLKPGEAGQLARGFVAAQTEDLLNKTIEQVGEARAGRDVQRRRQAEAGRQQVEDRFEQEALLIEDIDNLINQAQRSRGLNTGVIGTGVGLLEDLKLGIQNLGPDVGGQAVQQRLGVAQQMIEGGPSQFLPINPQDRPALERQLELLTRSVDRWVDEQAATRKAIQENTNSTDRNTNSGDRRDATRPDTRAPEQDRAN